MAIPAWKKNTALPWNVEIVTPAIVRIGVVKATGEGMLAMGHLLLLTQISSEDKYVGL